MGDSGQPLFPENSTFLSVVFVQHSVETMSVVAMQHKYSVEATSIYINQEKNMVARLLERLAEMFPKQDTPVIPFNQYETGKTKEFTQNQFDNDAKIPFSDALEIAEEVTGEDPSWSQGVMENIEGNFDAGGDNIINYTNEDEVISNQTEVEKIGEEIFNEIYPMIEEGASDAEINQEIDKKILEKVDKEVK